MTLASPSTEDTVVGSAIVPATVEAVKEGINPSGESSHQLRALHGLRFLAAFCILFSHACAWLANFQDHDGIVRFGDFFTVYGMPLFFVLSGFVIHYNYSKLFVTMRPHWAIVEFLGARFARIYPLFICFLLVGVAVDGMLQWPYEHKFNLLLAMAHALTLTQSWVYIVIFGDRLVLDNGYGLSWSLSTEFFFYVTYVALVLHIVRLKKISSLLITAGIMSAVVFAVLIYAADHRAEISAFAALHMNDHFDNWEHSVFRWFFYYSPYVRVFEFILGCLTAQIYARLADQKVSPRELVFGRYLLIGALLYLSGVALLYSFEPFGPVVARYVELLKLNYGCAVPIAAVIFCVTRYRTSAVAALLSTPLMVVLGDLSYSIYTVHTWTLRIFSRPQMSYQFGVALEAVVRIALAIALTIILSVATYRLIEVPARAWLRKSVSRHLARSLGPRDLNVLPAGQAAGNCCSVAIAMVFIGIIGAVAAYQFLIVPHFSPYTR
jgi:peptidoglycan/LPS O-acetylase OafA/YrhL